MSLVRVPLPVTSRYNCEAGRLVSGDRNYPVRRVSITGQAVKYLSEGLGFDAGRYGIHAEMGKVRRVGGRTVELEEAKEVKEEEVFETLKGEAVEEDTVEEVVVEQEGADAAVLEAKTVQLVADDEKRVDTEENAPPLTTEKTNPKSRNLPCAMENERSRQAELRTRRSRRR